MSYEQRTKQMVVSGRGLFDVAGVFLEVGCGGRVVVEEEEEGKEGNGKGKGEGAKGH